MNVIKSALPQGWISATLTEIAANKKNAIKRGPFGSSIKKEYFVPSGYKVYEQKNAIYNDFTLGEYYINNEKFTELRDFEVVPGDVLISCSGTIGKLAIAPEGLQKGIINQALLKLTLHRDLIDNKYFAYLFSSYIYKQMLKETRGSAMQNISSVQALKQIFFPLAPLAEQHRIVARIEELFNRLDAGVEELKKAKVQVQRYRQSVLKAAVEGRLTAEWRETHPEVEPAEKLLKRIISLKQGKLGRKYKESQELDTRDLPILPESWLWSRLDSLAELKGGITKDKKRVVSNGRKVPYLRVANVQRGYLDLDEIKEIEASEEVISDLHLERGDILFNEGGDRDKLGRGWIWQEELPECIHQNHVFRARLYSNEVSNKFVSWFGNTFGQTYFLKEGKQTTNLASVNLTKLSAFPVPLPPIQEQRVIAEKVDNFLSITDDSERIMDQNLEQTFILRQSILMRAFQGKLVPQDSNDEPASVLLDRIRAERIKQTPTKSRKNNNNGRQMRLVQ